MSLYSPKGIVDPVETWVNTRLKMYGGKGGERKMQTWGNRNWRCGRVVSGDVGYPSNQQKVKTEVIYFSNIKLEDHLRLFQKG